MPITKSAKKAVRQSKKRHNRNLKRAENYKNAIKSLKKSVIQKDKKSATALLPGVYKAIDKAVKTNVIKKNTASRLKSRLTKVVNKL